MYVVKNHSVDAGKAATSVEVPSVIPRVDFGAVMAIQRKNLEALTEANKLAIEGIQAVVRRQFEIGREIADEISTTFRDFAQPTDSLQDRVARQSEYSKQAVERRLSNAREIGELVTKANTDAFNVIGKRVIESIDEVRDYATKHVASR